MKIKLISSLITALVLSGCSSMQQQENFGSFNGKLNEGDFSAAAEIALENAGYDEETGITSDLLWSIQAGAVLNYTGDYERSTKLFDASESLMKSEDQEGLLKNSAETIGSVIGNDAMLDYEQTQYDGVMANTIKAWNFISQENFSDARVELNRAEDRQRRAAEHFAAAIKEKEKELAGDSSESNVIVQKTLESKQIQDSLAKAGIEQGKWKPYEGYVNPFTTYTYGLNLLLTGSSKSDFQKAADAFKRVASITDSKVVKQDYTLARTLAKQGKKAQLANNVWVIFENGQSIVREEARLDIPLFLVTDQVSYTGIALPKLKKRGLAYNHILANNTKTEMVTDMDKIIGAEFDLEFPYILAREVTRVVVKTIAQEQANDHNAFLGGALAILQAASTGADIRSFSALPSQYQVTHVEAKNGKVTITAGDYTLPVELDKSANSHIIYVKAISPFVQPTVRIINI